MRHVTLLKNHDPFLYQQLHTEMNLVAGIEVDNLSRGSDQKVWWQCVDHVEHFWSASPRYRAQGQGCSMCIKTYIVHGVNDMSITNPALYTQLHHELNREHDIDISRLNPGSHQKVWWQCQKDIRHTWASVIKDRNNGRGCLLCSNQYVVHGINDLSVANPYLYKKLHRELNESHGIRTDNLSPSGTRKVWWKCDINPEHYWLTKVNAMATKDSNGCSMCNNLYVVPGVNDLSVTHPHFYQQLHTVRNAEAGIDTTKLVYGSDKKVWWQCDKEPSHYWFAKVAGRSNGRNCAMCSSIFVVQGINDLSATNPNLFNELDCERNEQEGLDTTLLTGGSDKQVWWKCKKNRKHSWASATKDRTRGNGCPLCAMSRTETEFRELFSKITGEKFISTKIEGSRSFAKRNLIQIDMLSKTLKLAVEYDSHWAHGENELHKRTREDGVERDSITTAAILKAGYTVVRIRELPLGALAIDDPNFFQFFYKTKADKSKVVLECLQKVNLI